MSAASWSVWSHDEPGLRRKSHSVTVTTGQHWKWIGAFSQLERNSNLNNPATTSTIGGSDLTAGGSKPGCHHLSKQKSSKDFQDSRSARSARSDPFGCWSSSSGLAMKNEKYERKRYRESGLTRADTSSTDDHSTDPHNTCEHSSTTRSTFAVEIKLCHAHTSHEMRHKLDSLFVWCHLASKSTTRYSSKPGKISIIMAARNFKRSWALQTTIFKIYRHKPTNMAKVSQRSQDLYSKASPEKDFLWDTSWSCNSHCSLADRWHARCFLALFRQNPQPSTNWSTVDVASNEQPQTITSKAGSFWGQWLVHQTSQGHFDQAKSQSHGPSSQPTSWFRELPPLALRQYQCPKSQRGWTKEGTWWPVVNIQPLVFCWSFVVSGNSVKECTSTVERILKPVKPTCSMLFKTLRPCTLLHKIPSRIQPLLYEGVNVGRMFAQVQLPGCRQKWLGGQKWMTTLKNAPTKADIGTGNKEKNG